MTDRILFATSELQPLAWTGGLGEVCRALPLALAQSGCDVRIAVPGYRRVLRAADGWPVRGECLLPGLHGPVRIREGRLEESAVAIYVVDAPELFDRDGGLYGRPDGSDWPDNIQRFVQFSRAVIAMARDQAGLGWRPDVLHAHDWQAGLACFLAREATDRPATVFTIHNLAYAGIGERARYDAAGLPPEYFAPHALEFHGNFSLLKGGLVGADLITTVSPGYAQEIQTHELGFGFDGLLRQRHADLAGVLNGADYGIWDPRNDPHIAWGYDAGRLHLKRENKLALQRELGLSPDANAMLCTVVARFAYQKGIDLLLGAIPELLDAPLQFAILGEGDPSLQDWLRSLAASNPGRVACALGFIPDLSHRMIAGADALVMPSRYEPCGLTQLYALRYGTVPVVRGTGGLRDTVTGAEPQALAEGRATGIVFDEASSASLAIALRRALALFQQPAAWLAMQQAGMRADFSWTASARAYLDIYRRARQHAPGKKGSGKKRSE